MKMRAKGIPHLGWPPSVVPTWQWKEPSEDDPCRCIEVFVDSLRRVPAWEDVLSVVPQKQYLTINRCNLLMRERRGFTGSGCRLGPNCTHCHVHPVDPKGNEEDWRWQLALGKRERAAAKAAMSPGQKGINRCLTPLIQAVKEDSQFYIELGKPYCGIHIMIVMVHRLMEDIPKTRHRMSKQFGIPEDYLGIVCSADCEVEGASHFNRRELLDKKGKLAYLTQTKFLATRAPHLCQMTNAQGILWVEKDAVWLKGVEGRFPQVAALLKTIDTWCHVGYYTWTQDVQWFPPEAYIGPGDDGKWPYPYITAVGLGKAYPVKASTAWYTDRRTLPEIATKMRETMPFAMGPDILWHTQFWYREYLYLSCSLCGQDPSMWSSAGGYWKIPSSS